MQKKTAQLYDLQKGWLQRGIILPKEPKQYIKAMQMITELFQNAYINTLSIKGSNVFDYKITQFVGKYDSFIKKKLDSL